jgi:hypothetical protein
VLTGQFLPIAQMPGFILGRQRRLFFGRHVDIQLQGCPDNKHSVNIPSTLDSRVYIAQYQPIN